MEAEDNREKSPKTLWGFMQGQITVPDDFDDMEAQTIEAMFAGEDEERHDLDE